jgi:hypothetical protein
MTKVVHTVEPFKTINSKLANGWACYLIADFDQGIRLQMCDSDPDDDFWRYCIVGQTLDECVGKAVILSQRYTPNQFSNMTWLHCRGHS